MRTSKFEGGAGSSMELLAPAGTDLDRIVLIGLGDPTKLTATDLEKLGGTALGTVEKATGTLTLVLEQLAGAPFKAGEIAARAGMAWFCALTFDRYKPNKPAKKAARLTVATAETPPRAGCSTNWMPWRKAHCWRAIWSMSVKHSDAARICAPRQTAHQAGCEGRSALRSANEKTRHGFLAGRRAGQRTPQPNGRDAMAGAAKSKSRWPLSARAFVSTRAVFRSSRRPAWKT